MSGQLLIYCLAYRSWVLASASTDWGWFPAALAYILLCSAPAIASLRPVVMAAAAAGSAPHPLSAGSTSDSSAPSSASGPPASGDGGGSGAAAEDASPVPIVPRPLRPGEVRASDFATLRSVILVYCNIALALFKVGSDRSRTRCTDLCHWRY